jgi:bifunctional non-homologous end joining protein LigD
MGNLQAYRDKRDFALTREPAGKTSHGTGHLFVVQKHDATRLHWDLRLEWGGVLLSWAVTRGPSEATSAKRLAVRTEDHPLDYVDFEGTIPKGQYGGGTVMLWDDGTYEPLNDFVAGLHDGSLKFRLSGHRMKGAWALVRMKPRAGERRENWLLIKERDGFAFDDAERLVRIHDTSVRTGRTMAEIAAGEPVAQKRGPTGTVPEFRPLQLATSADEPPRGDGWLHEVKYDGYRCLMAVAPPTARFFTRSGLDWSDTFAALGHDARALRCASALIDGEVTTPEGGTKAFGLLQRRLELGGPLVMMAFDLLELDGADLTGLPLDERKRRLKLLIGDDGGAIRFADHIDGQGDAVWTHAKASGWEGIISKKADAPYRGGRQSNWLKVKHARRQEFVIGGWKGSAVKGRPFASLLVGTMQDGALQYRGGVGSGFDDAALDSMMARLIPLAQKAASFVNAPADLRDAHWVRPMLVCEVQFTGFTNDGHIRHGVFIGLRGDKMADEVELEPAPRAPGNGGASLRGATITHPEHLIFDKPAVTKFALAKYLDDLSDRILPFVKDRPLSLLRCPDGAAEACFFQKHRTAGMPSAIAEAGSAATGAEDYIAIGTAAGLVAAAQMGTIELHVWGSRISAIEFPDRLVFDLDPDEALGFEAVRAAAVEVRDLLDDLGLASSPMLSGGKGIHVVAPLRKSAEWPTVKLFARTVAVCLAARAPERFTSTMAKADRKGKIFIDWLRNERGATAIAPYSPRARAGAHIAAPLTWAELQKASGANQYDVFNVGDLLARPCPLLAARKHATGLGPRNLRALEAAI